MACMQGWVFLFFEIKCYPWNTLWMVIHLVLFPFLFSKCKYDTVYSKYDQMLETGGFQIRFSSRKRTFLFQPSSSGAFAFSFREDNHPQHRVKYCKTWEDSITFPYLPTPSIFRCFAVSFREATVYLWLLKPVTLNLVSTKQYACKLKEAEPIFRGDSSRASWVNHCEITSD